MGVTISLLGLLNYNPDVLSGLQIPEEWESMNTEDLHFKIIEETAELEVIYANPEYMQSSITRWASSRMYTWNRIYEALTAEYNPIWNKDGTVTESTIHGAQTETRAYGAKTGSTAYGQQQNSTAYGARSTTANIGARSGETTESVSAFNASTYQPASKTNTTQQAATDSASELAHTDTETLGAHTDTVNEQAHTDTVGQATYTDTNTRTEQGNIGVTTTQQMLTEEMKLRTAYDMYTIIAEEFKKRYCILVY